MQSSKDRFPPLLSIGLGLYTAKKKKDPKLAGFLDAMIIKEFIFLQIDFISIYYAINGQYKIERPLRETIDFTRRLIGFSRKDPEAFDMFNKALGLIERKSKRKKGIKLLEKIMKMSPDNPIYMMELLKIYQREGKFEKVNKIKDIATKKLDSFRDKSKLTRKLEKMLKEIPSINKELSKLKAKYSIPKDAGGFDLLKKNILEIVNHLKGKEGSINNKILRTTIEESLNILEWFSQIATTSLFALNLNMDPKDLQELSEIVVSFLGWEPEPLPKIQTPNFLSPALRKKAWIRTLGFDILTLSAIDSPKDAVYMHMDGDLANDDPETHIWYAKNTAERMNIGFEHESHSKSEGTKIQEHLESHFGKDFTVIHQKVSKMVHIDINILRPTKGRNYGLFVSSGMSELPMNSPPDVWKWWKIDINKIPAESRSAFNCDYAELVIKVPPDWPFPEGELKKDEYFWVIEEMHRLINYVHKNNEWFWDGHTMRSSNDDSVTFASNTKLAGWLFVFPPKSLPKEFSILKISPGKCICFLQLIPLYIEEIHFAARYGTPALLKKFEEHNIKDNIDLNRPNVVI